METFIKADIFFFVTTIALVVLTLLLATMLYYGIRFSRNMYLVSRDVKKEIDSVVLVVRTVREFVEDKGVSAMRFASKFIPDVVAQKTTKKKTVKKNK